MSLKWKLSFDIWL